MDAFVMGSGIVFDLSTGYTAFVYRTRASGQKVEISARSRHRRRALAKCRAAALFDRLEHGTRRAHVHSTRPLNRRFP